MVYLYLHGPKDDINEPNSDLIIGEFKNVVEAHEYVQIVFEFMNEQYGIDRMHFYSMDEKGNRNVCWVMGR